MNYKLFRSNFLLASISIIGIKYKQLSYCEPTSTSTNNNNNNNNDLKLEEKLIQSKPYLDKIYEDNLKTNHIPSVIYGLVKDGKLLYWNSFGTTNPNDINSKPTIKSAYRIASMSKSFTAMAILKLRDNGLLSLHDDVSNYIPELKQLKPLTKDSPKLTIYHLLTMQSGYPQDDPWADRLLNQSRSDFYKLITSDLTSSYPIATEFEYSNLNYAILGEIITRVSGIPYQQYITNNIFKPLQMNDTVFDCQLVSSETLVDGYRWEENQFKLEPLLADGTFGAMGGIITTLDDYVKYISYHQSGSPNSSLYQTYNGPEILLPSSLREMHRSLIHVDVVLNKPSTISTSTSPSTSPTTITTTPATFASSMGYSYGLSVWNDTRGVKTVRHAGGLPGFGSEWRFLPNHGVAIVSFGNKTYAPMDSSNAQAINYLVDNKIIEKRKFPLSDILKKRGEELIETIQNNFNNNDLKDIEMFSFNFYLDKPKRLWQQDIKQLLQTINGIENISEITPENNLRGTFIITGKNNNKLKVFYSMTPENVPKIQYLEISKHQETL